MTTAGTEPCSVTPVAVYYYSQTNAAAKLGISRNTFASMRERYPDFPEPDAWIGVDGGPLPADPRENPQANGKSTPGWTEASVEKMKRFREQDMAGQGARTDLRRKDAAGSPAIP